MPAQNQIRLIATQADKNVAKPAAVWEVPAHIEVEIEAQRSITVVQSKTPFWTIQRLEEGITLIALGMIFLPYPA